MSKENVISKKEPFARMVKRDHISVGKAWAIRLIAVALSLVVAALVIVAVTKQNPIEVYLGILSKFMTNIALDTINVSLIYHLFLAELILNS